uniref:Uncharacterized protein n=1 Tax=Arundo donax TaxID=35708 RepID=A0A0A9HK72_ARUDO
MVGSTFTENLFCTELLFLSMILKE